MPSRAWRGAEERRGAPLENGAWGRPWARCSGRAALVQVKPWLRPQSQAHACIRFYELVRSAGRQVDGVRGSERGRGARRAAVLYSSAYWYGMHEELMTSIN